MYTKTKRIEVVSLPATPTRTSMPMLSISRQFRSCPSSTVTKQARAASCISPSLDAACWSSNCSPPFAVTSLRAVLFPCTAMDKQRSNQHKAYQNSMNGTTSSQSPKSFNECLTLVSRTYVQQRLDIQNHCNNKLID